MRPVLQQPSQTCWPPAPKCFAASCRVDTVAFLLKIIYLVASGLRGFPSAASGKEPACQCRRQEMRVPSLSPLEEGMATHSSILAWSIP